MLFRRAVSEILNEQNRLTKHFLQIFYIDIILLICVFFTTIAVAQELQCGYTDNTFNVECFSIIVSLFCRQEHSCFTG